jgi:hypothetical protein
VTNSTQVKEFEFQTKHPLTWTQKFILKLYQISFSLIRILTNQQIKCMIKMLMMVISKTVTRGDIVASLKNRMATVTHPTIST